MNLPNPYWVCGADLSLRRPGFSLVKIVLVDGKPHIDSVKLISVNNKGKKEITHGEILREIKRKFEEFIGNCNLFEKDTFFVREKMVMNKKVPSERDVAKVVGVMDYVLTDEWEEIYPVTIKKLITGSGKATKEEVAEALEKYVGKLDYKCDDESDATAVAIAWLIQQGQIEEKI